MVNLHRLVERRVGMHATWAAMEGLLRWSINRGEPGILGAATEVDSIYFDECQVATGVTRRGKFCTC